MSRCIPTLAHFFCLTTYFIFLFYSLPRPRARSLSYYILSLIFKLPQLYSYTMQPFPLLTHVRQNPQNPQNTYHTRYFRGLHNSPKKKQIQKSRDRDKNTRKHAPKYQKTRNNRTHTLPCAFEHRKYKTTHPDPQPLPQFFDHISLPAPHTPFTQPHLSSPYSLPPVKSSNTFPHQTHRICPPPGRTNTALQFMKPRCKLV